MLFGRAGLEPHAAGAFPGFACGCIFKISVRSSLSENGVDFSQA
jgi:hypothetical protein